MLYRSTLNFSPGTTLNRMRNCTGGPATHLLFNSVPFATCSAIPWKRLSLATQETPSCCFEGITFALQTTSPDSLAARNAAGYLGRRRCRKHPNSAACPWATHNNTAASANRTLLGKASNSKSPSFVMAKGLNLLIAVLPHMVTVTIPNSLLTSGTPTSRNAKEMRWFIDHTQSAAPPPQTPSPPMAPALSFSRSTASPPSPIRQRRLPHLPHRRVRTHGPYCVATVDTTVSRPTPCSRSAKSPSRAARSGRRRNSPAPHWPPLSMSAPCTLCSGTPSKMAPPSPPATPQNSAAHPASGSACARSRRCSSPSSPGRYSPHSDAVLHCRLCRSLASITTVHCHRLAARAMRRITGESLAPSTSLAAAPQTAESTRQLPPARMPARNTLLCSLIERRQHLVCRNSPTRVASSMISSSMA